MKKTAIILGATGLTGSKLLQMLLDNDSFEKVLLFSRSSVGFQHPKISEHLVDLFQLENYKNDFHGDVVYCCIGTTKSQTPDKEKYRKIDYGIPVTAAQLCNQNRIETYIVISALGANPESRVFYNKVKGEMERDVLAEKIPNTYILQPSLIGGDRSEKRIGERIGQILMSVFGFLIPKKYKMIHPETIAKAMVVLSEKTVEGNRISSDRIREISHEYND